MELSLKTPSNSGHILWSGTRAHKTLSRVESPFYCHASSYTSSDCRWSYDSSPACCKQSFWSSRSNDVSFLYAVYFLLKLF